MVIDNSEDSTVVLAQSHVLLKNTIACFLFVELNDHLLTNISIPQKILPCG